MEIVMNKNIAAIGYCFLFGAAIGLFVGVLTHNLWIWLIAGAAAGLLIGWIVYMISNRK